MMKISRISGDCSRFSALPFFFFSSSPLAAKFFFLLSLFFHISAQVGFCVGVVRRQPEAARSFLFSSSLLSPLSLPNCRAHKMVGMRKSEAFDMVRASAICPFFPSLPPFHYWHFPFLFHPHSSSKFGSPRRRRRGE